jgi:hypothetical protein
VYLVTAAWAPDNRTLTRHLIPSFDKGDVRSFSLNESDVTETINIAIYDNKNGVKKVILNSIRMEEWECLAKVKSLEVY